MSRAVNSIIFVIMFDTMLNAIRSAAQEKTQRRMNWQRLKQQSCYMFVLAYLLQLQTCSSRSWLDVLDPTSVSDGMPEYTHRNTDWIEIHGNVVPMFQEIDSTFVFTEEPSPTPSSQPSSEPSLDPTRQPTPPPTYAAAVTPVNPPKGYFNYDPSSPYGPARWNKVRVENDFWHTFDLNSNKDSNDCSSNGQSPIDLCVRPRDSCTETHEMRPKSGDYKMDSDYITKEILPNKLRLVMAPRTGEEPDPPKVDFSSNGKGVMDMTNIDFKFPSEHSVCGQKFDGEMQYYAYHPGRRRFVAVVFFLEGECKKYMQQLRTSVIVDHQIVFHTFLCSINNLSKK